MSFVFDEGHWMKWDSLRVDSSGPSDVQKGHFSTAQVLLPEHIFSQPSEFIGQHPLLAAFKNKQFISVISLLNE